MKIKEIPQDDSALRDFTNEVCYAKNEEGKYETSLSKGWDVKKTALDAAWSDIDQQQADALASVKNRTASPIYYFMLKNLMDISLVSQYTGFWKITIKRHFKPNVFDKLSDSKLEKYAKAFNITINELKNI
jgi:hypothetical protein